MSDGRELRVSDHAVEQVISRLLQFGVGLAALVVLAGGIMLLLQHGGEPAVYSPFRGEPELFRALGPIVGGALRLDPGAVIQFGLVLLVATPVARVALTMVAFALQRDRKYVLLTALVLVLLLYGLFFGSA
jgi:uncharacterized membrane protein